MVKDQHEKITGYRDLSQSEIDKINRGKALSEKVGAWIDELQRDPTLDQHWIEIGCTQIQLGFMAALRGIAQPTTF